jgi:hypothetical protein
MELGTPRRGMPETSSAIVMTLGYRLCSISFAWIARSESATRKRSITYEHKIYNTFLIHLISKVLMIASREAGANTMVHIHHTRNTIEAESIKLIDVHIEAQIRQ